MAALEKQYFYFRGYNTHTPGSFLALVLWHLGHALLEVFVLGIRGVADVREEAHSSVGCLPQHPSLPTPG